MLLSPQEEKHIVHPVRSFKGGLWGLQFILFSRKDPENT